jgi:hypothetical protein
MDTSTIISIVSLIISVLTASLSYYIFFYENKPKFKINLKMVDTLHVITKLEIEINNIGKIKRVVRAPKLKPNLFFNDKRQQAFEGQYEEDIYPLIMEPNAYFLDNVSVQGWAQWIQMSGAKKIRVEIEDTTGVKYYSKWLKIPPVGKHKDEHQ